MHCIALDDLDCKVVQSDAIAGHRSACRSSELSGDDGMPVRSTQRILMFLVRISHEKVCPMYAGCTRAVLSGKGTIRRRTGASGGFGDGPWQKVLAGKRHKPRCKESITCEIALLEDRGVSFTILIRLLSQLAPARI
jgi:hypothetical protein